MKALKSHPQIERPHRMKKRINQVKHTAELVLALICLPSALAAPGYCWNQQFSPQSPISPAANSAWNNTGNLNAGRVGHTATLLPSGNVLVAGGSSGKGALNTAEFYDADTGAWSITGNLNSGRVGHTATLLPNGKILVAGGNTSLTPPSVGVTSSAELFDPATGTWSTTGSLNTGHFGHTATLLPNGKLLVTAGWNGSGPLKSAELYDPHTETWTITGSLLAARYWHTATLLQSGKVLVAGGSDDGDLASTLASAELYEPDTGTWGVTGSLEATRVLHTATLLAGGKVLVVGGYTWPPVSLSGAELYDPDTGTWSDISKLNGPRNSHSATLLSSGTVLIAGGDDWNRRSLLNSAELYHSATGIWDSATNLNTPRSGHTATLLSNGQVLLAGGSNGGGALNSAELYDAATGTIATPKIVGVSVAGKKLFILGENFDPGAVILLNGEEQKTRNDDQNSRTTVIGKNAGKRIKPGDKLQVRNPNGTVSEEFAFAGA